MKFATVISLSLAAVLVKSDPCGDKYSSQSACDADSSCTWCVCHALPSACWTTANAKKLPAGVYTCDSKHSHKPGFLRKTRQVVAHVSDEWNSNISKKAPIVLHGLLDKNHCEEIYIPTTDPTLYSRFMHSDGWRYKGYTKGLCDANFTTYEKKTRDGHYPQIIHLKRGKGAAGGVTISLDPCTGDSPKITGITWKISPESPAKGSTVSIVATGSLTESVTDGQYTINAKFGSLQLVDKTTSNCDSASISLPLGIGTVKASGFSCPQAEGSVTFTVDLPVPNLSGSVTAKASSVDGSGNELFCVDMTMAL